MLLPVSPDAFERPGPRVLVIDLERIPGRVTLDIFDAKQRSDYIHASRWDEYPETLCFSWRWLGERTTQFAATWQGDDLAATSHRLYSEATHVLGFNQRKADNRWCRNDWLLAGLPEPAPWRDIDLYVIARSQLAMEARSLDFLCQRLGLPGKRGHYSIDEARAAHAGDVKAQRRMERYNRGDVKATIDVWERLRPLVKVPGLNLGLAYGDEEFRCSKCGHDRLDRQPQTADTPQTAYALYRCRKCQGLTRSSHRYARSKMRGVV
jgi:DNA-directed RNA polymerase subunit M/transcription elongation factor TFIIS